MNPWTVRNFLICQPQPRLIRVTNSDGVQQEIIPGRRSRVKLAETIVALSPDLIECLDAEGNVIRASRPDAERSRSLEGPSTPEILANDPQTAMLSHFASLLHRSYEHATDIAFEKLIELVERMDARTQSIEERLERTEAAYRREQRERIDDLYDRAEEEAERAEQGNGQQQIVSSLLQGAMMGKAERGRPTNGKGKES